MKNVIIVFLLFSLTGFGQEKQEICMQTHPNEVYVLSYTTDNHQILIGYGTFLATFGRHEELQAAMKSYIDAKVSGQATVELNIKGQMIEVDDELFDVRELTHNLAMIPLFNSGNLQVFNNLGRKGLNNIVLTRKQGDKETLFMYEDSESGEVVFSHNRRHLRGCFL